MQEKFTENRNFYKLRKGKNLTLAQLADLSGYSISTLNALELKGEGSNRLKEKVLSILLDNHQEDEFLSEKLNKTESRQAIAARISSAVKASGRKAKDIAAAVGITEVTLSKYSTGVSTPKNENLLQLAEELNVSVSWLLYGCEELDETEQWKRRALAAEEKLKMLKSAMQGLLKKI